MTAVPPTAPAPSGSVGENPPVMSAGGEHYGEDWSNYGHDFDQVKPTQAGDTQASDSAERQEVGHP